MPDPLGPPPDNPTATQAETEALREAIRRARDLVDKGEAGYVAAVLSGVVRRTVPCPSSP